MKTDKETLWHAGVPCPAAEACEIPGRSCLALCSSCLRSEKNQNPTDGFL